MGTKNERYLNIWHQFNQENDHQPTSTREVAKWAVEQGLAELPEVDPYDVLATQMSRALRCEYKKDEHGRRYRVNHAVCATRSAVQKTIWATIDEASREHMEESFGQRRERIIGNCLQLKTDVDIYNDKNESAEPIQAVLDFSDDVEERQVFQSEIESRPTSYPPNEPRLHS